ncbi:MAG: ABC transporter ATP-binding protein [Bacillota bacterium]
MKREKLLEVNNLRVVFSTHTAEVEAVKGIDFCLYKGETLGIVGESGAGKSTVGLAVIGLHAFSPGAVLSGSIFYDGEDLIKKSESHLQALRGARIAMVFQDPFACLNPTMKIGRQVTEVLRFKKGFSWKEAKLDAAVLLKDAAIHEPHRLMQMYPHQLSTGMLQRIALVMALACGPELLIADEPTSALDITTLWQTLEIIENSKDKFGTSIIFLTHNLAVAAGFCDRVLVMYGGKVVEEGPAEAVFSLPMHPYLRKLVSSIPGTSRYDRRHALSWAGHIQVQPTACVYYAHCHERLSLCQENQPGIFNVASGHYVSCWLYGVDL